MADPDNPSIYYDSRFHYRAGESEASLLGVVSTDAGIMTAAPYRVIEASHWVFESSALKASDLFGTDGLQERWQALSDRVAQHMKGSDGRASSRRRGD